VKNLRDNKKYNITIENENEEINLFRLRRGYLALFKEIQAHCSKCFHRTNSSLLDLSPPGYNSLNTKYNSTTMDKS